MKKMKTLFNRHFVNHKIVGIDEVPVESCEWVIKGEGVATQKLDGTCCLIQDGKLFSRFDWKKGRKLPEGAIPCQPEADPITGSFPQLGVMQFESAEKFRERPKITSTG